MKTFSTHKFTLALAILAFTLCSCSTWHYNHSRVKVDPVRTQDMAYSTPVKNTTASQIQEEATNTFNTNVSEVSSVEKEPVIAPVKKQNHIPAVKTKQAKPNKVNLFTYTKKLVSESKLLKVKDVEKTAISGWLRLFILFLVIGFVLVIVGIILSVVVPAPLWWLFYLFGALLLVAAFIILILGLVGVMA